MRYGPTYQDYFGDIERIVREMLNQADSQELLKVDFEEHLARMIAELKREPLLWYEGDKTIETFAVKEQRQGHSRPHTVEHQRFRLRIPTSPHSNRQEYLKLRPSARTFSYDEPRWRWEEDVLVVETTEATEHSVERTLAAVRWWLDNRNKDIEEGNASLPARTRAVWERSASSLRKFTERSMRR